MRLRACMGMVLLCAGGCAQVPLPDRVRVEVGDNAVEVEGRCPPPPAEEEGDGDGV